jgi:hypothetical protein
MKSLASSAIQIKMIINTEKKDWEGGSIDVLSYYNINNRQFRYGGCGRLTGNEAARFGVTSRNYLSLGATALGEPWPPLQPSLYNQCVLP